MKQRIITIEFMLKDLQFDPFNNNFSLSADKIQDVYCIDDDFDAEEMLEKDGLEYIIFNKKYC